MTAAEVEALAAALRKDNGMTLAEYPELPATLDAIAATLRGYEAQQRALNEALNSDDGSYRP